MPAGRAGEEIDGQRDHHLSAGEDAEVDVLASLDGHPVLCRQGAVLAAAFHPELTDDRRLHQLFVDSVKIRDIPVVQACCLIFAGAYILLNLMADVLSGGPVPPGTTYRSTGPAAGEAWTMRTRASVATRRMSSTSTSASMSASRSTA